MRESFRHIFSALVLAALASAPLGCGDDDGGADAGSEEDAGGADAGAEVTPPTGSDVTAAPARTPVGEQAAQPR